MPDRPQNFAMIIYRHVGAADITYCWVIPSREGYFFPRLEIPEGHDPLELVKEFCITKALPWTSIMAEGIVTQPCPRSYNYLFTVSLDCMLPGAGEWVEAEHLYSQATPLDVVAKRAIDSVSRW